MQPPKIPFPPPWIDRLLQWRLPDEQFEEVQGDMHELYAQWVEEMGERKANRQYLLNTLTFLRPLPKRKNAFQLKHTQYSQANPFDMIRNYLTIALRHLVKNKLYAALNISGLGLGIAACLLIALFIKDELSYDKHYPNADRLYRVVGEYHESGGIEKDVDFPAPFAKVLLADYPEIEQTARIITSELFGAGTNQIRRTDKQENTYEEGLMYADPELVDLLSIPIIQGDLKQALNKPHTLLISKRKADKYFPNENPIGKTMILNDSKDRIYTVGGVMENFPSHSHLQYDFLLSLKEHEFWPGEQTFWRAYNYNTYVLLRPGADAAQVEKKLLGIIDNYIIPSRQKAGIVDAVTASKKLKFNLQSITDIHLKSGDIRDGLTHGDIRFVYIFGAIVAFILLIACINFINLSTAKSANRAKEVGIRKVVGSFRSNLIKQFLTESIIFSFLSFIVGFLIASLLLPYFNELSAKSLSLTSWREWWLIPFLGGAALIIGIVAGLYPAFYLSAFKPIEVLKGKLSRGSKGATTRNVLVVFQFTTSIILLVGTIVIHRQMGYILNKKVGFEKDQVLLLQGTITLGDKVQTLKTELLRLPTVKQVSISDYLPIQGTKRNGNSFWKEGKITDDSPTDSQLWRLDHDYIKTMGMNLVAGWDFSTKLASDSGAVIVNQQLAKELGLQDPIGKRITNGSPWTIIGVAENFHFESMRDSISPVVLALGNSPSIVSVKVNTANMQHLLQSANKVWEDIAPNQPIRYSFMDENFARMYEDIQRTGRVFSSFAILAIFIACLGLYGLSSFIVEQRTKEIGIRLVLGASLKSISSLLTLNFAKLILLSIAIAIPAAWYMMHKWLEDFVYRTEIGLDVFLLAGITVIVITLLTISYQIIKTALMNPANSLRNE